MSDSPSHPAGGERPLLRVDGLTKYFDTEDSLLDRLFGDTTNPVRAVDGLDFEIQRGETFGLVGESGCGKSTTGEAVLQLLTPTSGSVEFDGQELVGSDDLFDFRRRTGVVFQDPYSSIDPRMTVGEIIKQPLDIHGWPWPADDVTTTAEIDGDDLDPAITVADDVHRVDGVEPVDGVVTVPITVKRTDPHATSPPQKATAQPDDEWATVEVAGSAVQVGTPLALTVSVTGGEALTIDVSVGRSDSQLRLERAADFLERVGLSADQLDRYPNEFSGGQRQRIGIARALVLDPDFLVLDEPTSALDVSVQAQVLNLLADLKEEFDLTYLIISHDLSVIRHICDRVAVMYLGELVEVAPADELFTDPKHPYTEALLESVPRPDVSERDRDIDPLTGDVPSPRNPPSGCRFRTRCPQVIPPDGIDLDQQQYRAIMNVRDRIESTALGGDDDDADDLSVDAVLDRLIDVSLPPDHRARLEEAVGRAIDGEFAEAASLLDEPYSSICERDNPSLIGEHHPVACHLHNEPDR